MIDHLHYISQPDGTGSHLPAIDKAIAAGCKWIQLRIKDREPAFILEHAFAAKAICDASDAKLIVNDHPEIAVAAGAYGLHLGLLDMPIVAARQIVGPEMIIGGTANTFEHVLQRVKEGADYVGLGPFRFTSTKKKLSPILGLTGFINIMEQLKQNEIDIPVIAIGGLTAEDIPALMDAGIYGVAMSAAITFSNKPETVVLSLQTALQLSINHLKR
jgi:thiamine-phosphate pyrophosphorylase